MCGLKGLEKQNMFVCTYIYFFHDDVTRVFKVVYDRSGNQHRNPYRHTRCRETLKTTLKYQQQQNVCSVTFCIPSSPDIINNHKL